MNLAASTFKFSTRSVRFSFSVGLLVLSRLHHSLNVRSLFRSIMAEPNTLQFPPSLGDAEHGGLSSIVLVNSCTDFKVFVPPGSHHNLTPMVFDIDPNEERLSSGQAKQSEEKITPRVLDES